APAGAADRRLHLCSDTCRTLSNSSSSWRASLPTLNFGYHLIGRTQHASHSELDDPRTKFVQTQRQPIPPGHHYFPFIAQVSPEDSASAALRAHAVLGGIHPLAIGALGGVGGEICGNVPGGNGANTNIARSQFQARCLPEGHKGILTGGIGSHARYGNMGGDR